MSFDQVMQWLNHYQSLIVLVVLFLVYKFAGPKAAQNLQANLRTMEKSVGGFLASEVGQFIINAAYAAVENYARKNPGTPVDKLKMGLQYARDLLHKLGVTPPPELDHVLTGAFTIRHEEETKKSPLPPADSPAKP